MGRKQPGTVYLLHFSVKLAHAAHYIGWVGAGRTPEDRLADHVAGRGARITAVATERGITLTVARTWVGGRKLERKLKKWKGAARLCPVCKAARPQGGMRCS